MVRPEILSRSRPALSVAVIALILLAGFGPAKAEPFDDEIPARIEAYLKHRFDDRPGGMVVGIVNESGRVNGENAIKPDTETVFEIGSITKTFTSLLALEMVRTIAPCSNICAHAWQSCDDAAKETMFWHAHDP